MLIAAAGPPVSGNTEAVGVAVALAEGLGEPLSDGNGVKEPPVVLATGLELALGVGLAVGVAVESPPLGKVSQAIPSSAPPSSSSPLGSLGSRLYSAWASS